MTNTTFAALAHFSPASIAAIHRVRLALRSVPVMTPLPLNERNQLRDDVLSIELEVLHLHERHSKRTRMIEAQKTAIKARLDLCKARVKDVRRMSLVGCIFSALKEVALLEEETVAIEKDEAALEAAVAQTSAAIEWEVRVYVAVVAQLYAALWARNAEMDNTLKSRLAAWAFQSLANSFCYTAGA